MIAFRRISKADDGVVIRGKTSARFKLEKNFKNRAMKRMEKGLPLKKVLSTSATVDRVKKTMAKNKNKAKNPKKRQDKKQKANSGKKN